MSFVELENCIRNILEEIKRSDLEIKSKLKLLGLAEEKVIKAIEQLIDRELEPDLTRVATILKNG